MEYVIFDGSGPVEITPSIYHPPKNHVYIVSYIQQTWSRLGCKMHQFKPNLTEAKLEIFARSKVG